MNTVVAITSSIEQLPPEQEAEIRTWLNERAGENWDAEIEDDERSGRLDALADKALAEHRASRKA